LNDTREILEIIFDNAPDGIAIVNDMGNIVAWNPALEKMLGWHKDEVENKFLSDVLFRQNNEQQSVGDILGTPFVSQILRLPIFLKEGKEIDAEISISNTLINKVSHFILFIRAANRKAATKAQVLNNSIEEQLREATIRQTENEWKYRNLFENHPMPMWVLEVPTLRFLDVNESAIIQYGYSREEFLGMTSFDIRPDEDILPLKRLDRTVPGTQNRGVWRHFKKDGTLIFVEVIVHEINYQGKNARLVLSKDITEQQKAVQSLELSERRFRSIFDSKLIGFFVWSPERGIVHANQIFLEMLGYTHQELMDGKVRWDQLTPSAYAMDDELVIQQINLAGTCDPIEKEYIRKDNSLIPVLVGSASIGEGLIVSYTLDIREQKAMASQILELNKNLERRVEERTNELLIANSELESFSYSVSHDLRTPLRAIHGYTAILAEDYKEILDEGASQLLTKIKANAKKMGQLVDDLLRFSRTGKIPVKRSLVNMNSIVESVLATFQEIDIKKVKTTIHELGTDKVDRNLMQVVFQNLISNAITYSSPTTPLEIEIGVADENGIKKYFVKDNGLGFDMKYHDKLFVVFQRLHNEDEFDGTGIGLAIVHRIISRHAGQIWAESKINEGATFYFTLNN
jgi:PAS domain S-box-containing protein